MCIVAALALSNAVAAPVRAADACVLVSHGSKKSRPTYRAVADAVQANIPRTARIEADRFDEPGALAVCERVAIAVGVEALKVAHRHFTDLPVVYVLAQSAEQALSNHPLRYGISATADPGHELSTLRAIAPAVKRIGLVFNPKRTGELVSLAKRVAESRDLEIVALETDGTDASAIKAFHRFEKEISVDALWLLPDSTVMYRETADYALKLALWGRLPVVGPSRSYVASGALFALAPDPEVHGRLAATAAKRLLRGETPPSLQYPSDNHLLLSQRMADKLGLRLPPELVGRAEELIR